MYYAHWHNVRYEMGKRVERLQMRVASKLPKWAKKWAFIEVTNRYFIDSGEVMGDVRAVDAMQHYFYPNEG